LEIKSKALWRKHAVLRYDIVVVSTLLHCNSSHGQDDDDDDGRAALNVALLMTVVIMAGTIVVP
jgi:hypothetical protein